MLGIRDAGRLCHLTHFWQRLKKLFVGTEHSFIRRTCAVTVGHRAACGSAARWRRWEVGWCACLTRTSREVGQFLRLLCMRWIAVIAVVVAGLVCFMFLLRSVRRAVDVSACRHTEGQSLPVSLPGKCPVVSAQCIASLLSSSRRCAIAAV